jgi:ribosome-associated translation inhibitor RaiA
MTVPLKLVDQGHLLSPKLVEHIRERAEKLSRFFSRVKECRVTVDGAGQHSRAGRVRVRVYLQLRDARIAINRRSAEDLATAIRISFDAADQRLEDHARLQRKPARRRRKRGA